MIDTMQKVSTPEGVELELRVAGVYARGAAYLMDLLIRVIAIVVLSCPFGMLGGTGVGLLLIVWFLAEFLYPIFFEVFRGGATPGKRMFGIRVVNGDGTPIGWQASIVRNLTRFADWFPALYLVGIFTMVFTERFARLGDLAAGTLVVYKEEARRLPEFKGVDPVMPRVSLQQHEQRAILEFAERREDWVPKRQQELANLVESLTGERDKAGVDKLAGIATWLVEGR